MKQNVEPLPFLGSRWPPWSSTCARQGQAQARAGGLAPGVSRLLEHPEDLLQIPLGDAAAGILHLEDQGAGVLYARGDADRDQAARWGELKSRLQQVDQDLDDAAASPRRRQHRRSPDDPRHGGGHGAQ